MPTLYSLTIKFLDKPEKREEFKKAVAALRDKSKKTAVGSHASKSIESLHKALQDTTDDPKTIREKIQALLDEKEFKKGASGIEFRRGVDVGKTLSVKNEKLLQFIDKQEIELEKLIRYTIDSIKEVPLPYDPARGVTETKEIIRVVKAIINPKKFQSITDGINLSDFLKSSNWLEEELDEKGEKVEFHLTRAQVKDRLRIKDRQISEGRVILVYEKNAFDISELVRQRAKESYGKLLKSEGKRVQRRRAKK